VTKPKPIPADLARDGYQVVVSFTLGFDGKRIGAEQVRSSLRNLLPALYAPRWKVTGLDVAVREIGAQGEQSQMEGEGP
jgi:hypothetical protein